VIHTYRLNPKCIKMGELYGEYNLLTNEWTDGLASTIIRGAVADTSLDGKWVVFDGPVDAVWIENMNTGELPLNLPPCMMPATACTCTWCHVTVC
jgi:dynein heavy chain